MSVGTHTHSNICYNIANRKSVSTHLQQQQKKRINNEEENIEMKNSVYVCQFGSTLEYEFLHIELK